MLSKHATVAVWVFRVASLLIFVALLVHLITSWPGDPAIRPLLAISFAATSLLAYLPSLIVGLLRPLIAEEAERVAVLMFVDLANQVEKVIAREFQKRAVAENRARQIAEEERAVMEKERKATEISQQLRVQLGRVEKSEGRAPVYTLRSPDSAD